MAWLTVSGCGWNYASQMEKADQNAKKAHPHPTVAPVEVAPAPPADLGQRLEYDHRNGIGAQGPAEMGVHAFSVDTIDGASEANRVIHCSSGKVIRFTHRPTAPQALVAARANGVPLAKWTLLADPTGAHPSLPGPVMLRHLNVYHRLEFAKRYDDGRVLYIYDGLKESGR